MGGPLYQYLAQDHARLDALLRDASARQGEVVQGPYEDFRAGLLRHIGIEEKILFPLVKREGGPESRTLVARLHRDHAALAEMLVPTPTWQIIGTIHSVLVGHNEAEESSGGLYDTVEQLAGDDLEALLAQAQAAPLTRVAPHHDGPTVRETIRALMEAAEASEAN